MQGKVFSDAYEWLKLMSHGLPVETRRKALLQIFRAQNPNLCSRCNKDAYPIVLIISGERICSNCEIASRQP